MPNRKKSSRLRELEKVSDKRRVRMLGVKPTDGPLIRDALGILSRYRIEELISHPLLDNAPEETTEL
jgi:hypothetical protein